MQCTVFSLNPLWDTYLHAGKWHGTLIMLPRASILARVNLSLRPQGVHRAGKHLRRSVLHAACPNVAISLPGINKLRARTTETSDAPHVAHDIYTAPESRAASCIYT